MKKNNTTTSNPTPKTTLSFTNDPNEFLRVTIDATSTEKLQKEHLKQVEKARTGLVYDDRVPQFTGTDYGVMKGPDRHVHTPEDGAMISQGHRQDGVVHPAFYDLPPAGGKKNKLANMGGLKVASKVGNKDTTIYAQPSDLSGNEFNR
jgi:hypothetical protein